MPGTSGVLSPFGQIEGLYFNNSSEPDDFEFNFKKDLSRVLEEEGVERIEIKADNKEEKIPDDMYQGNYENKKHNQRKSRKDRKNNNSTE